MMPELGFACKINERVAIALSAFEGGFLPIALFGLR